MQEHFHLDFETKSEADLEVVGLDNYLKHPSTAVLMAAYARGDRQVKLWEPHKSSMPAELEDALLDPFTTAEAWNATFERGVTKYVLKIDKPIYEWRDPSANARYLSMPGRLADAGRILGLGEEHMKDSEGERLIKLFCEPAVEAKEASLFGPIPAGFRDWSTDPADWKRFGGYCIQDVVSERAQGKKMSRFALPEHEWAIWHLDQKINETGLPVDLDLVRGAHKIVGIEIEKQIGRLKELTGLENPNSRDQLLAWLATQGYTFSSLKKAFVMRAMGGECELTTLGKEVIEIRNQTSKSSVKKYLAIANNVSADGRLRYQFTYMGAARTARWASLGINLQNLSKPTKAVEKNIELAMELVQKMDYEGVLREFGKPLEVVSSILRSSFQAGHGKKLVVCDLNAIENRGLGYVARCEAILRVFREGRDPYLDFATSLYEEDYATLYHEYKVLKNSTKRTNSKPASLGCGYRLSGGEEVITPEGDKIYTGLMGYSRSMGIEMSQEDAHKSVKVFREKFPEVVQLWFDMERAMKRSIRHPGELVGVGLPITPADFIYFEKKGRRTDLEPIVLFRTTRDKMTEMLLPSGRSLHYIRPKAEIVEQQGARGSYKKVVLSYEGQNQKTRQWGRVATHGGKLVENAVQAIARDVLASGLVHADKAGFEIVGHVHDEIISLVPEDSPLDDEKLAECMAIQPPWTKGQLPLAAAGYCGQYYRK